MADNATTDHSSQLQQNATADYDPDDQYQKGYHSNAVADHDSEEQAEWGTLPLDWYMIEDWNPDESSPEQQREQRLRLVREFVASGSVGRDPYNKKAVQFEDFERPTADQIKDILAPVRSPALRAVALQQLGGPYFDRRYPFVWLRTTYDDEEKHTAFVDESGHLMTDNLTYEGLVLDDKRYYEWNGQWQQILDVLPEVLCTVPKDETSEPFDEESLQQDYMKALPQAAASGESLAIQYAWATDTIQHGLDVLLLLVEDAESYTTSPPTFNTFWLDDHGAVVRSMRCDLDGVEHYLATEGWNCDASAFTEARVGPDYLPGGRRGPPHGSAADPGNLMETLQGKDESELAYEWTPLDER